MRLAPALRKAVAEVDPNRPLANIRTVEQNLAQQIQEPRYYMLLLAVFAAVATALAGSGARVDDGRPLHRSLDQVSAGAGLATASTAARS